jgi:Cu/Ag efflux protein CusF
MNKKICFSALLIASVMTAVPVAAQHAPATASTAAQGVGEVIELDRPNQRVIVRHEEIKSIPMQAMTMPFHVRDGKLLDRLKPGAKIRFTIARIDGAWTLLTAEDP